MQFTHSGLEGWHVGEAEPEDGPRRGEAWLFGIANATRGAIREADAERSPRPGTRDPANEEPPRTNALKPAVPSNAVPASELYHPRGGARYRRTCIEHLMLMPHHDTLALDGTLPSPPTVCLMDKTLSRLHRG